MPDQLLLALGRKGLTLSPPKGVALRVPRPVRPEAVRMPAQDVRRELDALRDLAMGRRRATVLLGDLTFPAPYEAVLPALVEVLVAAGVRPTRVGFLCCPGKSDPVLGRAAVRRYGDDVAGNHEVNAWRSTEDRFYAGADLRLAVLPSLPDLSSALPEGAAVERVLHLTPGQGLAAELAALTVQERPAARASVDAAQAEAATVQLVTAGGAPWEATLEEALVGLRYLPPARAGQTVVLAFAGDEGLGSAPFTLRLLDWLREASAPGDAPGWTPLGALQAALAPERRVVLFAPELAQHAEGDDLRELLAASPALAERLVLAGSEAEVWAALERLHGHAYELFAEPLGWRAHGG